MSWGGEGGHREGVLAVASARGGTGYFSDLLSKNLGEISKCVTAANGGEKWDGNGGCKGEEERGYWTKAVGGMGGDQEREVKLIPERQKSTTRGRRPIWGK